MSKAYTSMFFYNQGKHKIFVFVYVDDIIVGSSSPEASVVHARDLHKDVALKDLGDLRYFLGIEVEITNKGMLMKQERYAIELLSRTHMKNCKSDHSPDSLR
jgi:hypothetical protein